uniref:Reverse transcriptase domain-containing protein n=1 Tax=Denticeps clupeoides TaxID=299321 RepID=A0AAY4E4P4_9TELE
MHHLFNDPHFKKQIKREMHFYLDMNDKGDVSPPILWDALKAVLRGKIIMLREIFLPNLIDNDQTGFIRERQTQDNIQRTLQIINHIQKDKIAAMVISIDAEKAFNWSFTPSR